MHRMGAQVHGLQMNESTCTIPHPPPPSYVTAFPRRPNAQQSESLWAIFNVQYPPLPSPLDWGGGLISNIKCLSCVARSPAK